MVLRPQPGNQYLVLGDSFVYGLHDAAALLGPLPEPWIARFKDSTSSNGRLSYRFFNEKTGEETPEDPRLDPDPDWERIHEEDLGRELTGDESSFCEFFRHKTTGEARYTDSRLSADALKARGVPLRAFSLI